MKRFLSQASFALVCLLLGLMLTWQFRLLSQKNSIVRANSGGDPSSVLMEVENLKKQKSELQNMNGNVLAELKKLEAAASQESEITKDMGRRLNDSRLLLGLVDVHGPGLIIYITPKSSVFNDINRYVRDVEIIHLINELYFGGAEAISVNDNRITFQSFIRMTSNNSDIIINDDKIPKGTRITLKAIGDKNRLDDAINFPDVTTYDALKNYDVKTEKSNDIKIEKYKKPYNLDKIMPFEEKMK